jgi:hypothetical protein
MANSLADYLVFGYNASVDFPDVCLTSKDGIDRPRLFSLLFWGRGNIKISPHYPETS